MGINFFSTNFNAPSKSLSIVVPVLNEADGIAALLPDLSQVLNAIGYPWEIVVVDDGSSDHLEDVLAQFSSEHPDANLQLLRLSRNFGKECALTAGLEAARGEAVICMDGDGQHPPEVIRKMVECWESGKEMVVGIQDRRRVERSSLIRIKSLFYRYLQSDERFTIPANGGDFRLMDRKVVNALLRLPERTRFMKGLYAWLGFRTELISFEPNVRTKGESKFMFRQLFDLALTGITAFSMRPLRLVARIGLAMSGLAMLYGSYIVCDTLIFGNEQSGWATLAAGMMLLSGIQLVCLGVIAEYLGRVFEECKRRPLYIVAQSTDRSCLSLPQHGLEERFATATS